MINDEYSDAEKPMKVLYVPNVEDYHDSWDHKYYNKVTTIGCKLCQFVSIPVRPKLNV